MKIEKLFLLTVLALIVSSCTSVAVKPTGTKTSTPTVTYTVTETSSPTLTTTPTYTSTPTITPTPTSTPISFSDAVEQGVIERIKTFGYGELFAAEYSPEGDIIAFATSVGLYIYDANEFTELKFIPSKKDITSLAFTSDGKKLAGGDIEGGIVVWEIPTYEQFVNIKADTSDIASLVFSPDDQFLVTTYGHDKNKVIIWRTDDWSLEKELYFSGIIQPLFSNDGEILFLDNLLISAKDSRWTVRNEIDRYMQNGKQKFIRGVNDIALSPDGTQIAIASSNREEKIIVLDYVSGEVIGVLRQKHFEGFSDDFFHDVDSISFLSSGDQIVFTGWVFSGLFDLNEEKIIYYSDVGGNRYVSPDITGTSPSGDVVLGQHVRDSKSWDILAQLPISNVENGINVFDDDPGNVSASGKWRVDYERETGKITLVDTEKSTQIYTVQAHRPLKHSIADVIYSVTEIDFSPDETFFVTGGYDRQVKLWTVGNEASSITLGRMQDGVDSIAISPDSTFIAVGAGEQFKVWNIAEKKPQSICGIYRNDRNAIFDLVFSPDAEILVTNGKDVELINIWDISDCIVLDTLNNLTRVKDLQFSDDGTILYSRSENIIHWWGAK